MATKAVVRLTNIVTYSCHAFFRTKTPMMSRAIPTDRRMTAPNSFRSMTSHPAYAPALSTSLLKIRVLDIIGKKMKKTSAEAQNCDRKPDAHGTFGEPNDEGPCGEPIWTFWTLSKVVQMSKVPPLGKPQGNQRVLDSV